MNIHPPGSITGYANPKCYARGDQNCSSKISKEHFVSESLLRQIQLNNTAKVAGLNWQQKESFNVVPLSGLASSILCERHNNALSPLDACMGSFAQAIGDYDAAEKVSTSAGDSEQRHFCGDDLERWMVKCLLGLSKSKNINTTNLKPECIDLLFGNAPWPDGWGMYFSASSAETLYHSGSFLIETKVDPARDLVLATKYTIRGLPLTLCFGKPDNPKGFGLLRPEAIVFRNGACDKALVISWIEGPKSPPILLSRAGTVDGAPPDWKEWERAL